jgi:peptidoglycan/xylan/chitin deacetylase (PgdA/CDA1 family)
MHYKLILLLLSGVFLLSGCVSSTAGLSSSLEHQTPAIVQNDVKIAADPAKKVYLTFDDGPNSHFTEQILDILKNSGVKATFVVIGSNIEKNPVVFKRILNEGHSVVNHTFSHDCTKIYASSEAFQAELDRCDKLISSFGGSTLKIYRVPGGSSSLSKTFYDSLTKNGYKTLDWNVSSADSDRKGVSPEQIIENVKNGVIRMESMEKPPIILMHDGTQISLNVDNPGEAVENYIRSRKSDVAALPEIINFLQSRGYTFAGVDDNTPSAW